MNRWFLGLAAFSALIISESNVSASPFYTVVELNGPSLGWFSSAYSVNDCGQVCGISSFGGSATAFLTGSNGSNPFNIGTLVGCNNYDYLSDGYGVNNYGQVVGDSDTLNSGGHAFLSGFNGVNLSDLGISGTATSINNHGCVTGVDYSNGEIAFLADPNTGLMKYLGVLNGGTSSMGSGINAFGQVTGRSSTATGATHAFLSDPNGGALHDLGTLNCDAYSCGRSVNDYGQVTGFSLSADGTEHGFLSDPNGGALRCLGLLCGGTYSEVESVNNAGQVVGVAEAGKNSVGDSIAHAFIYSNGVMTDLNSLIAPMSNGSVVLENARSISNTGYIAGVGSFSDGQHGFLLIPNSELTAVPEPSTLISAGIALVVVGAISLRRFRLG